MSETILWVIELEILPGKLEDFRSVVRELIANAQKEPDTLLYEWHLSADQTKCHVIERYRNSAALVKHSEGFGPYAARFMASCRPVRFSVYGSPSEEAKAEIAGLNPTYYALLGEVKR